MRERARAGPRRRRLVAAAVAAAAWCGAARADESEFRDWATDGGNHRRSAWVDVAPVHGDPVEAWSHDFGGEVLCHPVTGGGTLFVLARDAKQQEWLHAIDPRAGTVLARELRAASAGPRALVAARGGVVVVLEGTRAQGYVFRGKSLKREWTSDTLTSMDAVPFRGTILDDHGVYDARTGKRVVDGSSTVELPRHEPFAVVAEGENVRIVTPQLGFRANYRGTWAYLAERRIEGTSRPPGSWSFAPAVTRITGPVEGEYARLFPIPYGGATRPAWLLFGPHRTFPAASKEVLSTAVLPALGEGGLFDLGGRPAVVGGSAYAWSGDRRILVLDEKGASRALLDAGQVPASWPVGPLSAARNVLYGGPWALDLESRRVLWTKSPPSRVLPPAIPAADGVVVVRTEDGRLHGWVDPKAAPAAPSPSATPGDATQGPPAGAAGRSAGPVPSLPPAGDGVLLVDGRHLAGDVRRVDERTFVVTPPGAAATRVPAGEVLIAFSGGRVLHRADERDVAVPVRRAARFAHAVRLEQLASVAIEQELPGDSVRIAEESGRWGLPAERVAAIRNRAAGRREASSPELRRAPVGKRRAELEVASRRDFGAAAAWLAEAGCPTAATCLLADEAASCGGADVPRRAEALVPAEFPWRGSPDAGKRWLAWAEPLLAAGARFLSHEAPAAKEARVGPWRDAAVVVRTPNLLFVSSAEDPAIVGPCLRRGELAVAGLVRLLGEGDSPAEEAPHGRDRAPLQVRLHRNRAEYLREAGGGHLANSLGYYSPGERVSRFHVPDADEPGQPLGRGLFEVLAHELTHQWTDERWCVRGGRTVGTPAYWVVEGLARFVEDQVVDSETRVLTFDDATVTSLDTARELLRGGHLLPMAHLLVADQTWFLRLDVKPRIEVRPRRTAVAYVLSQSNVFYEQSSAVVFHLLRASGEAGRARFLAFLRKAYVGTVSARDVETLVGSESLHAYEAEFRKWLETSAR